MTRGEAIKEYENALEKDSNLIEVASIFYKKILQLFSCECANEEMRIRCIAEEIDNILCANERGRAKDE